MAAMALLLLSVLDWTIPRGCYRDDHTYPRGYPQARDAGRSTDERREIDVPVEGSSRSADGTLVDVREAGEYAEAHVPGAVLIPMGQLPSRLAELDRTEPCT